MTSEGDIRPRSDKRTWRGNSTGGHPPVALQSVPDVREGEDGECGHAVLLAERFPDRPLARLARGEASALDLLQGVGPEIDNRPVEMFQKRREGGLPRARHADNHEGSIFSRVLRGIFGGIFGFVGTGGV